MRRLCLLITRPEDHFETSGHTVLNTSTYVTIYCDPDDPTTLAEESLIIKIALERAWHGSSFNGPVDKTAEDQPSVDEVLSAGPRGSLKANTMVHTLDSALQSSPGTLAWIAEAEQLPAFTSALKVRFYIEPSLIQGHLVLDCYAER